MSKQICQADHETYLWTCLSILWLHTHQAPCSGSVKFSVQICPACSNPLVSLNHALTNWKSASLFGNRVFETPLNPNCTRCRCWKPTHQVVQSRRSTPCGRKAPMALGEPSAGFLESQDLRKLSVKRTFECSVACSSFLPCKEAVFCPNF